MSFFIGAGCAWFANDVPRKHVLVLMLIELKLWELWGGIADVQEGSNGRREIAWSRSRGRHGSSRSSWCPRLHAASWWQRVDEPVWGRLEEAKVPHDYVGARFLRSGLFEKRSWSTPMLRTDYLFDAAGRSRRCAVRLFIYYVLLKAHPSDRKSKRLNKNNFLSDWTIK